MAIEPVDNSEEVKQANSSQEANKTAPPGTVNGSTKFGNSMAQLREQEPALFNKIVEGLGMAMCQKMRRNQERNTRLRKEYQRNA